jgi:peptidyl-prolyl cis-trans isomerase SurA
MKQLVSFFLLIIAFVAIFSCQTSKTPLPTAKVDKKEINLITVGSSTVSVGEFKYVYEKNNANDSIAYSDKSVREYLDLFINFKLKVEEAKSKGLDTTREFLNEFVEYKKQLAKPYLTESKVTEGLVQEAYERLKEEIHASHILINASADASPADTLKAYNKIQEVRTRAVAGEDFGKLAVEYSEDPSAKQNKGDLGYFTALQMVYQFEDMAFKTPMNQISPVFRTRFGYHILKTYERRPSNGEIKIAHIYLRMDGDKDSALIASRAMEIDKRLQNGEAWDKLCAQFSNDEKSKNNGGIIDQLFSAGMLVKPLEEISFGLKEIGAISKPVKTIYGWHIIKLIERKGLAPFKEIENVLKQRVSKDSRSELNRTFLVQRIRKDNNFEENVKSKAYILSKADSSLVKGIWNFNRADENPSKTLFVINKNPYSIKNFFAYIEKEQQNKPNTSPSQYMENLYNQYVETTLLDYEESNLEEKYPEFRYLVNEYREGMLLFKIMEERVWGRGVSDVQGMEKFFEANRDKYRWDKRVKASIYTADRASMIDSLKAELNKDYIEDVKTKFEETVFKPKSITLTSAQWQSLSKVIEVMKKDTSAVLEMRSDYVQGESSGLVQERIDLIKAYLTSVGITEKKIAQKNLGLVKDKKNSTINYLIYANAKNLILAKFNQNNPLALQFDEGLFQKGDHKGLDMLAWEIGTYTIREGDKYHYITIQEVLSSRPKELSETKGVVISDYQQFLEKELIDELKKKYVMKVDENEVKKLIKK